MYTCPVCQRRFKTQNQFHMCSTQDVGVLFEHKPDHLVLAYAALVEAIEHWQPNTYGPSTHSVVFTSVKAWLIVKPMKQVLDLKFYLAQPLEHPLVKKVGRYGKKYAHHVRISYEEQVTLELLEVLKQGHAFSLQ